MRYFFTISDIENVKITHEKENMGLNEKIYTDYDLQMIEIKKIRGKNNYVNELMTKYDLSFKINELVFNIDLKNIAAIRCDLTNDTFNLYTLNNEKIQNPKKYTFLNQNMLSKSMIEKIKTMSYCEREKYVYNYKIKCISLFFDFLEEKGCVLITFFNFCNSDTVNVLYLLKCLFEQVIIRSGTHVYCQYFLGEKSLLKKKDIETLRDKHLTISKKTDLNELIDYLNENLLKMMDINDSLIKNNIDCYMDKISLSYFLQLEESNIKPDKKLINEFKLNFIKVYRRVYIEDKINKIHSAIKKEEINIIQEIIKNNRLIKCLEVGMAFGTSAISILMNENTHLISIDPFQTTQWASMGVKLVKSFHYQDRHTLIEEKSYIALPLLLKEHEKTFDFIFIDGWHTFDYTLLDVFYAGMLLKKGGFMIIDDVLHNGVKQCIKYIDTNYKFLKKNQSPNTVAVYEKIGEDKREWNFHVGF